ncbi:MAG: M20 family metallopeptidase [Desulfitobacteriaceae bacterium]|nr:M20 family metallopeptidase [Desulfitobacteriaceae bacterium]
MLELLHYLKESQGEMLTSLEQLVKAESPTNSRELVNKSCELVEQLFARHLDIRAEKIIQSQVGNHLKLTYGNGVEQILVLAHLDTVWDVGRLSFRVEGNRAYGPGILDMKGGIIQSLWAVKALRELGVRLNKRIVFLITSDEEIGSPTSRPYIEAEALKSKFVLVAEPAEAKTGALKTGRKGVGRFVLKVNGVATHAGNNHAQGVSAIEELAHQILKLHCLSDYEKGTTLNVGVIKGGTRSNVVAAEAEAEVDVRVATVAEGKRMEQAIIGLEPKLKGSSIFVTGEMNRPPLERTAAIGTLYEIARNIAGSLGFELGEASVGGGSDGNFTAALGIPTLDGLGCIGDGPHAESEHIEIDKLGERAALFANLLVKID